MAKEQKLEVAFRRGDCDAGLNELLEESECVQKSLFISADDISYLYFYGTWIKPYHINDQRHNDEGIVLVCKQFTLSVCEGKHH